MAWVSWFWVSWLGFRRFGFRGLGFVVSCFCACYKHGIPGPTPPKIHTRMSVPRTTFAYAWTAAPGVDDWSPVRNFNHTSLEQGYGIVHLLGCRGQDRIEQYPSDTRMPLTFPTSLEEENNYGHDRGITLFVLYDMDAEDMHKPENLAATHAAGRSIAGDALIVCLDEGAQCRRFRPRQMSQGGVVMRFATDT